jgi:hypothetical protein
MVDACHESKHASNQRLCHAPLQPANRVSVLLQVRALVLSAPYLPSQLEAFHATAAKLQHSLAVLLGASELHVVVSQLPWEEDDELAHDAHASEDELGQEPSRTQAAQQQQQQQQRMPAWQQVLLDAVGPALLLEPGQLAAAEDAEEALLVQQRLFSAAVWSAAAQQLNAKHCLLPWLAVLAVVGGEQLRSLRALAASQGLQLAVEDMWQQQQQQQHNPSAGTCRRRSRRSRKRTTTTDEVAAADRHAEAAAPETAAEAAHSVQLLTNAGPVQEVVLVLSKQPLAAADIAVARQQALASCSSSSSSSAAGAQLPYQPGMSMRLAGVRSRTSSASTTLSVAADSADAREVIGARMHVSEQDKGWKDLQSCSGK